MPGCPCELCSHIYGTAMVAWLNRMNRISLKAKTLSEQTADSVSIEHSAKAEFKIFTHLLRRLCTFVDDNFIVAKRTCKQSLKFLLYLTRTTALMKYRILRQLALLTLLTASIISTSVSAQDNKGERRGPPPEAVEACANLNVEAACSFSGQRGEVSGQCMAAPRDASSLACMPEAGLPRPEK